MGTGVRRTHEEFVAELEKRHPGKFKVLGKFVAVKVPVTVECMTCHHVWEGRPDGLLSNNGCRKCAKRLPWTRETLQEELDKRFPGKFLLLGEYKTAGTKILTRCLKCGNEWGAVPNGLLRGIGCPECFMKAKLWTQKSLQEELDKRFPNTCILKGHYVNTSTKVLFECRKCHHEWESTPNNILKGQGCPKCHHRLPWTKETLQEELDRKFPGKFLLVGDYITVNHRILTRCVKCGWEWQAIPGNLLSGEGCPHCHRSKGEDKIESYLKAHNIFFVKEYAPSWLEKLRGDFYLPAYNLIIEYDGEQHFRPVKNYGGEEGFKKVQARDAKKTKLCEQQGVGLLRIPYTELNNIDEVLERKLEQTPRLFQDIPW